MPIPNLFYGHQDALMRGASPTTLAVGDSWFWYPFDNLLGELRSIVLQSIFLRAPRHLECKGKHTELTKVVCPAAHA
ncbi:MULTISPECIES: hypothetical protein [unclassified Variovorax]|jgi:hypothetical protein|uniref:hypothetical protein n=1 Tax=unclassified Variovorax TaxID=663243 RepID=UPI000F7F7D3A|nr:MULTISPECIES: hypothetical protein [unclassified Variovorax]RSZ39930.1 hypothetical protein EJO70_18360 [Variovorax sp. 553]RSZ40364.1 hypothetical protein EJO71_15855 [Variovorax sp. 679]